MENKESTGIIQMFVILSLAAGMALIASKSGLLLLGCVLLFTSLLGQIVIFAVRGGSMVQPTVQDGPKSKTVPSPRLLSFKNAS